MEYNKFIEIIEKMVKSHNNKTLLENLQSLNLSPDLENYVIPKIDDLVSALLTKSINSILKNINNIFSDRNYLDLTLLEFIKDLVYINNIIKCTVTDDEYKTKIHNKVLENADKVFDILLKEAKKHDYIGEYTHIINNYKKKWSEKNEL